MVAFATKIPQISSPERMEMGRCGVIMGSAANTLAIPRGFH